MTDDPVPPAATRAELQATDSARLADLRVEAERLREELSACAQQAREQAAQARLAGEQLQHRARNTLALVRSAFKRTAQTGDSLEDVEMHFCGRLDVLAHYMLSHSARRGAMIDVQSVIRDELRNFQFGDAPGIIVRGPDAGLSLEQGQSFALAIHELATNSLKFGALSVSGAGLSVTWEIRHSRLKLIWDETGVPIVLSAPVPRGFGREFIEEALPYQTGAVTRFELRPGGVLCSIELALDPARQPFASDRET